VWRTRGSKHPRLILRHGGGGGGADVNVELTPLCSPNFKPGKPSELSQYIATILNRLVRTYVFPPLLLIMTMRRHLLALLLITINIDLGTSSQD
jgi:hypothetical protein